MSNVRTEALRRGRVQFGHAGQHRGTGAPDCPRELHHHHDQFCEQPTVAELTIAGIEPDVFASQSRR